MPSKPGRRRPLPRHRTCGLLVAAMLLAAGLPSSVTLASHDPNADGSDRLGVCPKKVAGLDFHSSHVYLADRGGSHVSCSYDNLRTYAKKGTKIDKIDVVVNWVERGATNPENQLETTLFCGIDAEARDLRADRVTSYDGEVDSQAGQRYVAAQWRSRLPRSGGKARKLAERLVQRFAPRAAICPGSPMDVPISDPDAAREVTLILSGDRLRAMIEGGGLGAIIPLEGDEAWGSVVSSADGSDPIRDDYLGSRGRVIDIGVSAADFDGNELVAVTVQVLPDDATGGSPPDEEPVSVGSAPPGPVEPSLEPEPTPAPTPIPAPTAEITPEPTATPEVTATPSLPSDEPGPSATSDPADVPTPGPSVGPARAEDPTATPTASVSPTAHLPEPARRILDALPPGVVDELAGQDERVSPDVAAALVVIDGIVAELAERATGDLRVDTTIGPDDISRLLAVLDRDGKIAGVDLVPGLIQVRLNDIPLPVAITPVVRPESGLLVFRLSPADIFSMRRIYPQAERLPIVAQDLVYAMVNSAGLTLTDVYVDESGLTIQAKLAE